MIVMVRILTITAITTTVVVIDIVSRIVVTEP